MKTDTFFESTNVFKYIEWIVLIFNMIMARNYNGMILKDTYYRFDTIAAINRLTIMNLCVPVKTLMSKYV